MNFPKFSESKGILKIGRSEVCVQGGVAEGQTLKSRLPVYIYISGWTFKIISFHEEKLREKVIIYYY